MRSRLLPSSHSRRSVTRVAASLASLSLLERWPGGTLAQEATPALDVNKADDPQTLSLVQYIHPQKTYFWVPGFADPTVLASLYDLDRGTYEALLTRFDMAARGAAEELLEDADFAARVDRLPFLPGSTVAVIGESDTDSLQSWFEVVRHLVSLRRPDDGIVFLNSGVSAMTTTQAFGPFAAVIAQDPDWIICALGGNDAVRIGPEPASTLVSLAETTRNLAELRRLAGLATEAQWIWLTRMPIDEARMEACAPFHMGAIDHMWRNADMDLINNWIRAQPEPAVEYRAAFGDPVPVDFQEPDGLHPTLAGHQALAREFVARITA